MAAKERTRFAWGVAASCNLRGIRPNCTTRMARLEVSRHLRFYHFLAYTSADLRTDEIGSHTLQCYFRDSSCLAKNLCDCGSAQHVWNCRFSMDDCRLTGEEVATPLLKSTIGNQQSAMKTWSLVAVVLRCDCCPASFPNYSGHLIIQISSANPLLRLLTTGVARADNGHCSGRMNRSFPRKRESSPTRAHFQRFVEWIPAFAGMTAFLMTPIPSGELN